MEIKTIAVILLVLFLLAVGVSILIYVSSGGSSQNSCDLYKIDGELAYRQVQIDEVRFGLDSGTVEQASENLLAAYKKYNDKEINKLLDEMELCREDVYLTRCLPVMNEMKQRVYLLVANRYRNEISCANNYTDYKNDGRLYLALAEYSDINISDSIFSSKETAIADALDYYDNSIIKNYTTTYRTCYEKEKTNKSCYISIQYALFRVYDKMKERY